MSRPEARSSSLPIVVLLFGTLGMADVAHAKLNGIASIGCEGCHGGGNLAEVTLTPSNLDPALGETITLTITVSAANGGPAGLYLRASGATPGAFSIISGQNTKLLSPTSVVHSSPRAPSGGQVTFQVRWTASNTPGGVDFDVYALASNGNGSSGGDGPGEAHASVAFGCAGTTYYRDWDGDGVGAATSGTTRNCSVPPGYSAQDGDCNDNDERVWPGREEICNGRDDDCDGDIDENLPVRTFYPDADGDGYGVPSSDTVVACGPPKGYGEGTGDCADSDPTRHPGADEVCNFLDDDCDGQIDEGARVTCGIGWCARYGPSCDPNLCTPGRPEPERCNYLDDDCDGEVDEGDLCAAGETCVEGECVPAPAQPGPADGGTGGGSGGGPGPGGSSGSDGFGCVASPTAGGAMWGAMVLLLFGVRRRCGLRAPMRRPALMLVPVLLVVGGLACSREVSSSVLGMSYEPPPQMKLVREVAAPVPLAEFENGLEIRSIRAPLPPVEATGLDGLYAHVAREAKLPVKGELKRSTRGTIPAGPVARFELSGDTTQTLVYVVEGDGRYLVLTLTAPRLDYAARENKVERSMTTLRFR